jgi:hypothetical protein
MKEILQKFTKQRGTVDDSGKLLAGDQKKIVKLMIAVSYLPGIKRKLSNS